MNWEMYVKRFHLNPPEIQLPREDTVFKRYKEICQLLK